MIFSVAIILIVGIVAYFHYVQGFFSATLSAICAIFAAALALSYHESLALKLVGGKFTDSATSLSLLGIFVAVYIACRVVLDKSIPGNIRLPVTLDKIGAALMGLTAGVFSAGTLAIAAQALPFGVSVAGYSRFATIDKTDIQVAGGNGRMQDMYGFDVMKNDRINPADQSSLLLPADDIVFSFVKKLSDGGSLAGPQNLATMHPDYLSELFGQRLGVQTGGLHVAFNNDKEKQVELKGLYTVEAVNQADGEMTSIKSRWSPALQPKLASDAAKIIVVARLNFARSMSDSDNHIRVSTGSVRLVSGGKDVHPVGVIATAEGLVLRAYRPDDFLLVPTEGYLDFAFYVDRSDFGLTGDDKKSDLQMPPDTFIETKRLALIDLSGQTIARTVPPVPKDQKTIVQKKAIAVATGSPLPGGGSAASPTASGPLIVGVIAADANLFQDIALGTMPADGQEATLRSGKATVKEGKISKLEITPDDSLQVIRSGNAPVRELFAPAGQKVYQAKASVSSSQSDKWEWAGKLGQFELVDSDGTPYKVRGAVTKVKAGTTDKMVARYNAESDLGSLEGGGELRPTEVYLYFLVPESRKIADLKFDGKVIKHVG